MKSGTQDTKAPSRVGATCASRRDSSSAMRCARRLALGSSASHLVDLSTHRPVSRSRDLNIQKRDFSLRTKCAMATKSHMVPHASIKMMQNDAGYCCKSTTCACKNSLPLHHRARLSFDFEALAGHSHTTPTNFSAVAGVQLRSLCMGRGL